jgi:hypothetical protein
MKKINDLRRILSEKFFDAGNLALAALVFGSFLTEKTIRWSIVVIGLVFCILFYLLGIWLYAGGED